MIVCSCNVFTDHDVRSAVSAASQPPRTPSQVYGCLGCSAQCGRCARTIRKIMDEALGSCAGASCSGCPRGVHSHVENSRSETPLHAETLLHVETPLHAALVAVEAAA